jgi:DNA polymerase-3 subunit delta
MDHKSIISAVKNGEFAPVYLLHGEESFFIDAITDAIVQHALKDEERDFNQSILYGKDTDVETLITEAKGYPMMAERRLVVLREAQDLKQFEKLEGYAESPLESTVLVLCHKHKKFDSRKKLFKTISKNGVVFRSDLVPDYKLVDWINNYVKSKGYGISQKASMLLSEFLGNDLSKIVNELNKLYLLVEKGTTINDVHIEENIGISKDYNMFELSNAIGARDIPKAFAIVDYFEHNPKAGALIPIVNNLFTLFSQLMRIHFLENKSKVSVASALRVHPFVASKLLVACNIYKPKKIAANIAILHDFDLKSKGIGNSSASDGQLMKEMVYRLMN